MLSSVQSSIQQMSRSACPGSTGPFQPTMAFIFSLKSSESMYLLPHFLVFAFCIIPSSFRVKRTLYTVDLLKPISMRTLTLKPEPCAMIPTKRAKAMQVLLLAGIYQLLPFLFRHPWSCSPCEVDSIQCFFHLLSSPTYPSLGPR